MPKVLLPLLEEERQELLAEFPELTLEQLAALERAGRNLNARQRRVIAYRLQGMTNAEAALKAGIPARNGYRPRSEALQARNSVHGVAYMRALADAIGLSDRVMMRNLQQGLQAMRYELNPKTGEAVPMGPDWVTRWRYAQLILTAKGRMPDPKASQTQESAGAIVMRNTPSLAD